MRDDGIVLISGLEITIPTFSIMVISSYDFLLIK
jgi:hypothetical protein